MTIIARHFFTKHSRTAHVIDSASRSVGSQKAKEIRFQGGSMNVKLLRRIQEHILAEPKRFAMGIVDKRGCPGEPLGIAPDAFNAYSEHENGQKFPACGTMACIMGWGRILGATNEDTPMWDKLCAAIDWPQKFSSRYKKAKTPLARARIASARIDHFIKTKGAE